jgi:hypothetical protein
MNQTTEGENTADHLQARAAHIPGCVVRQSGITLKDLAALRNQLHQLRQGLTS